VLVTPTVIFGLAAFRLRLDPGALVEAAYQAGLLAAVGLVVGLLQETRRSAWPAVGLCLVVAALSGAGSAEERNCHNQWQGLLPCAGSHVGALPVVSDG
jgi:hypothetical protein